MSARDRLYRFSRTVSSGMLLLAVYYIAFFLVFFLLSGETIFTFDDNLGLMQLLSAVVMGLVFAAGHWWVFRKERAS